MTGKRGVGMKAHCGNSSYGWIALAALLTLPSLGLAAEKINMDPRAKLSKHSSRYFGPDPVYTNQKYDPEAQKFIYGGKRRNDEPFYPSIFGRRMYPSGQLSEGINLFGKKNMAYPRMMMFGDWRFAGALNEDNVDRRMEWVTRLNLEVDLQLTATEHLHALFRPLDENGEFTSCVSGSDNDDLNTCELKLDGQVDTLFFEGDIGQIINGITNSYTNIDLPFAVGLMPMVFHNGVWFNDVVRAVGFSIPAMNSRTFDISNMDMTFFWGWADVTTAVQNAAENDLAQIFGTNIFIEALEGYFEVGYGYTDDESGNDGDYHNVALSFTHRWKDILSMSERVVWNFGQTPGILDDQLTADGYALFLEMSWQTSLPYTLVPYTNFFLGVDKPQGLAKANGLLENVGITFQGDALTNFQIMDNTGNDTWGGAFGIEYLFDLDMQIVFELATVQIIGEANDPNRNLADAQYGAGFRFQKPLTSSLIFRADGNYIFQEGADERWGIRTEIRWKF